MKKKKIICIGAGDHASVVIENIELSKLYECVGLIDKDKKLKGRQSGKYKIIGDDSVLRKFKDHFFIMTIGNIKHQKLRAKIFEDTIKTGLKPANVIHPSAVISKSVTLGKGISIHAGCLINASARIGDNTILNTGCIIEHHAVVGKHSFVAPGAIVLGNVNIGEGAYIGAGAIIHQGIKIGKYAIVGAGAVVINDVKPGSTVIGVPAAEIIN